MLTALALLLLSAQAARGANQCDATGPRKDCGASARNALKADHQPELRRTPALDPTPQRPYPTLRPDQNACAPQYPSQAAQNGARSVCQRSFAIASVVQATSGSRPARARGAAMSQRQPRREQRRLPCPCASTRTEGTAPSSCPENCGHRVGDSMIDHRRFLCLLDAP